MTGLSAITTVRRGQLCLLVVAVPLCLRQRRQIWVDTDSDVVSADPIGKSIIDAKGDLLVGTSDNELTRVAVGSPGQILYADSSTASGVKWDDAPVAEEAVPFAQSVMGVY